MADDRILTLGDHGQIFRLIEGAIALDIEVGSIADRLSFQQKDGVKAVFLHCLLDLFLFRLVQDIAAVVGRLFFPKLHRITLLLFLFWDDLIAFSLVLFQQRRNIGPDHTENDHKHKN